MMSKHVEDCAAILSQAMRITAQGKWHVFCEYAAHVDCLTVRWESADTDYSQTGRYSHEGLRAYFGWGEPTKQLAAIRTELDKLEGGE
jgi:hypothetical protein